MNCLQPTGLGIDHPIIVVHDIEAVRSRYAALGFRMTSVGRHPWGTSTALAMFNRSSLELMGVYDDSLIDGYPTGYFRFGRFVKDRLTEREGVAFLALHSTDAQQSEAWAVGRGIACQGTIEFGRDVTLPDGRHDRTATTLKIFHDAAMPRLTNFACQQHRPELIYVPEWLEHPNSAFGIREVTIVTSGDDRAATLDRLRALFGEETIAGDTISTANGSYLLSDHQTFQDRFGGLPVGIQTSDGPAIGAVEVRIRNLDLLRGFADTSGFSYQMVGNALQLSEAVPFGNVFLRFAEDD